MPSNHFTLCCPLLLLPSIFPSIRVSSNESVLRIRWPKYWSFSFSISPSNEYSGPISFRMDWLDLPAVQGTLKGLLQYHSSKASILQHSKKKKKKACQRQNQQLTFTRCFFCDFFRWLSTLPILSHLIPKRGSYEMNIIISSLQMNKVRYKMIKKCSKSLTVNQL